MVNQYNDSIYITGLTVETPTSIAAPYVVSLHADSPELSEPVLYRDTTLTMSMNQNNHTYIQDSVFLFNTIGSSLLQIFEYNYTTNKITLRDSFEVDNAYGLFVDSFVPLSNNGYLVCGSNDQNDPNTYDMTMMYLSKDSINLFLEVDPNSRKYIHRTIFDSDSTFLAFVSSRNINDEMDNTAVIKFDLNFNKIWTYVSHLDLDNVDIGDAMIDSEGNILYTTFSAKSVFDTIAGSMVPKWTPKLEKLTADGTFIWNRSMGIHQHNEAPSDCRITRIVEAHEGDGYVFCGADTEFTFIDTTWRFATMGKFSNDGDIMWYRKYRTIDPSIISVHEFYDMVKTDDGGYLAVGRQVYVANNTGNKPFSMIIVKTDAQGKVENDPFTNVVNINNDVSFNIYPNPSSETLYINKDDKLAWQFTLLDFQGRSLVSDILSAEDATFMMDLSIYPAGQYFLHFKNKDDGRVYTHKVVVE